MMNFSINPNTLYYIALYLMVLLVRFFKLKKDEPGIGWKNHNFKQVFHVGLDVVYTASGLVILLLDDLREYVSVILLVYVLLLLLTAFIDSMEEKFKPNTVFLINLSVFLAILLTTVIYFQGRGSSSEHEYKVAIPYQDLALRQFYGAVLGDKKFIYITTITAKNELLAEAEAKKKMKEEVSSFSIKNRQPSPYDIVPFYDDVVVSKVK